MFAEQLTRTFKVLVGRQVVILSGEMISGFKNLDFWHFWGVFPPLNPHMGAELLNSFEEVLRGQLYDQKPSPIMVLCPKINHVRFWENLAKKVYLYFGTHGTCHMSS